MSNELIAVATTGSTLYVLLFDATGNVYNGATFEAPANANWTTYDIAMDEAGTTGIYRSSMPAVAAGAYSWLVYKQSGVAPAVGDAVIGAGSIEWDGAAQVTLSSRSTFAGGAVASVTGDVGGKVLGGGSGVLAGVGVQADMQQMDGSTTPVDNLVLALGNTDGIVAHPQGIADALKLAPTTGTPAAGSVNKHLDDILEDTGVTLPALLAGGGSTAYTDTITDDSSNPLDGVEVWITSDSGGASTVASTTTNTLGVFTVYLDPGTYYLWLAKGGYNFPNPTTITVT